MTNLFKNKKVVMATSLLVGVLMLSVSTFAEITSKSAYDKMKDSIKITADTLYSKVNSYTGELTVTLKDNDKVILTHTTKTKVDNEKKVIENSDLDTKDGKTTKTSNYRDPNIHMYENSDGTYHVTEYSNGINNNFKERNPLNEEHAADIEKIIDAAVIGLKDNLVIVENAEGSKVFSGSISENQVPALINTLSSYFFKTRIVGNSYQREQNDLPELKKDIYIKNVSGKANANNEGIIENVFATLTLTGNEENGLKHDITVEVLLNISDINKTVVAKPDLTGKTVQKNVVKGDLSIIDGSMFVGNYKSDIVSIQNGKFNKIGERVVVIAHGDAKNVEGRYYEKYFDDQSKEYKPIEFTFSAKLGTNEKNGGEFTITKEDGSKEVGHIYFDTRLGNINFFVASLQKNSPELFNSMFNRVFEN